MPNETTDLTDVTGDSTPGSLAVDPTAGAHYDTSNEFYKLWLDPSLTYSSAYFARGDESLEDAQMAKLDLAFAKIGLRPGHRLLDIGCGWGTAVLRAAEHHGAQAVGLTVSKAQFELAQARGSTRTGVEFRLEPWETYHGRFDRIVSFEALEHFTAAKYPAFFGRCRELLAADGRLLLQTITIGKPSRSFSLLRYAYFLHDQLFFRAELPRPEEVVKHAREAGLELLHVESLRPHYVRTIESWLANLERNREAAIEATDQATYEKYVRYLTGAGRYHKTGETNVYQLLFAVA